MDKQQRKEYMRQYRKQAVNDAVNCKREAVNKPEPVNSVNRIEWQDIDPAIFDGHGRGVPVKGYVLIARRSPAHQGADLIGEMQGVVKVDTWRQRLAHACTHGLMGWSCKPCLT